MLAPLTRMASNKRNYKWTKVIQDAFKKIKRSMACNTLLTYPDFNETFKIHTDADAFQLIAVIIHKDKPITLYRRNYWCPTVVHSNIEVTTKHR